MLLQATLKVARFVLVNDVLLSQLVQRADRFAQKLFGLFLIAALAQSFHYGTRRFMLVTVTVTLGFVCPDSLDC